MSMGTTAMKTSCDIVHERLRAARRAAGLTQAQLAAEVDCTQSAISMFELGRTEALAARTVVRMAERLGVPLEKGPPAPAVPPSVLLKLKFCPVDDCTANIPYTVRGHLCLKPSLVEAPANESTRCGSCGEVLEDRCPNNACGADVGRDDSFCMHCGTPYVPAVQLMRGAADRWAEEQRDRIRQVRAMATVRKFGT